MVTDALREELLMTTILAPWLASFSTIRAKWFTMSHLQYGQRKGDIIPY